jgi:hypothetical protein
MKEADRIIQIEQNQPKTSEMLDFMMHFAEAQFEVIPSITNDLKEMAQDCNDILEIIKQAREHAKLKTSH